MAASVLVLGATGLVASRLFELPTRCSFVAPLARVDVTDLDAVRRCLLSARPDVVLNAAAYTDVTQAWRDAGDIEGPCYRINVIGAGNVAAACAEVHVGLLHVSTDYVFNGTSETAYDENTAPDAVGDWYSYCKRVGEELVLTNAPQAAVVRIASPFRAHHARPDLARSILGKLAAGEVVHRFDDILSMPSYIDDIVAAFDHLAEARALGTFHVTNNRALSPYAFASLLAKTWGYPTHLVKPGSHSTYVRGGGRPYPQRLLLASSRLEATGFRMPPLEDALARLREATDS